jgi:hypothetical protein
VFEGFGLPPFSASWLRGLGFRAHRGGDTFGVGVPSK